MTRINIPTAQNVSIDVEEAGIGDRTIASIIDYLLLLTYGIGILIIIESLYADSHWIIYVLSLAPNFFYFPLSEIFLNGQSIGKKVQRIRVAKLDGTHPTIGDYIIRWLFRLIEIDATIGLLAMLTLLVRGKGQRLGDVAAGTVVIREPRPVTIDDTLYTQLDPNYVPVFNDVVHLSEDDILLVKEVLDALEDDERPTSVDTMASDLSQIVKDKTGISSALQDVDFLQTILKDYNHLKH